MIPSSMKSSESSSASRFFGLGGMYKPRNKKEKQPEAFTPALNDVLKEFEITGFDSDSYANKFFSENKENLARKHCEELMQKKVTVADELKAKVFLRYGDFIGASNEIASIENSMVQLRGLLSDFKATLKSLETSNLWLDTNSRRREEETGGIEEYAVDSSGEVGSIQWLSELPDELDSLLIERNFTESVTLLDQFKSLDLAIPDGSKLAIIKMEVEERQRRLLDLLSHDLQDPTLKKTDVQRIVSMLTKLGHREAARDTYLKSRSKLIQAQVKRLNFQGELSVYIQNMSDVIFQNLQIAANDFRELFMVGEGNNKSMMSGFMVWIADELHTFCTLFRSQVFGIAALSTVGDCLRACMMSCKKVEQYGLSVGFMIQKILGRELGQAVESHVQTVAAELQAATSQENWLALPVSVTETIQSNDRRTSAKVDKSAPSASKKTSSADVSKTVRYIKLTESAKVLFGRLHRFVSDFHKVFSPQYYAGLSYQIYPAALDGVTQLIEDYVSWLADAAKGEALNDQQMISLLANLHYIKTELLPQITNRFEKLAVHPLIQELKKCVTVVEEEFQRSMESFCERRAFDLVTDKFDRQRSEYQRHDDLSREVPAASAAVVKVTDFLELFYAMLTDTLDKRTSDKWFPVLLEQCLDNLELLFFGDNVEEIAFGRGGVQLLTLDLKYFQEFTVRKGWNNSTINKIIESIIDQALESKRGSPLELLPDVWFSTAVSKALDPRLPPPKGTTSVPSTSGLEEEGNSDSN